MPINPNIALQVRGLELQNPIAQYGQIAQLQNAQNQNALAQYQLGAAKRAETTQNVLSDAYSQSIDPTTGTINYNKLTGLLAKGGGGSQIPAIEKTRREIEAAALSAKNVQSQIDERNFGLQRKKVDFAWNAVGSAPTPQAAIAELTKGVQNGVFDINSVTQDIQQLQSMTPDQYQQYRVQKIMGILEAKDKLGFMLPKVARQDIGGKIQTIQDNPALPGYGLPIANADIAKTKTFADLTAEKNLGVSQGQLSLAQQKFAFEQANPTLSIQEDQNGLLAVNPRTGAATPVVYGPNGFQAAPAATPGASIMRQPTAAMPSQRNPAIPGMPSVLDQTAAPARMPMPAVDGGRVAGAPVSSKREAPAKFNDTDMQLSGLAGSLKEFKDEVKKNMFTGARFTPTGSDTARMQAKYTALLMGVKDLYTLGALAGPDMSIIESQLTNPASWSGKFTSQKGFEEQVKVIEDMLKRTAGNLENTYNRPPRATKKAIEALSGDNGEWSVVR